VQSIPDCEADYPAYASIGRDVHEKYVYTASPVDGTERSSVGSKQSGPEQQQSGRCARPADLHAMISETLEHQLRITRASALTMRVLYLRRLAERLRWLACAGFPQQPARPGAGTPQGFIRFRLLDMARNLHAIDAGASRRGTRRRKPPHCECHVNDW
jgi:hypothetical protein